MIPYRPLRLASASHLPLAGEDCATPLPPPRRRPGPNRETWLTKAALRYSSLSNWAPAFAGVEQVGWGKYCKYPLLYAPLVPLI